MKTFSMILQSDRVQTRTLYKIWLYLLPLPALLLAPMLTPLAGSPRYWQFLHWSLVILFMGRLVLMFGCTLKVVDKENPADQRAYWRVRPFAPTEILLAKLWFVFSRLLLSLAGFVALELLLLNRGRFPVQTFGMLLLFHSTAAWIVFLAVLGGRDEREATLCVLGVPFGLSILFQSPLDRFFDQLNWSLYQVLPHGIPLRFILVGSWILLAVYWVWHCYQHPRPAWRGWLRVALLALLTRPVFTLRAPPRLEEVSASADFLHPRAQVNRSGHSREGQNYTFSVQLHPELFSPDSIEPAGLKFQTLHSITPGGTRLMQPNDGVIIFNPNLVGERAVRSLTLARKVPRRAVGEESGLLQAWIKRTPLQLGAVRTLPLHPGAQFTENGATYHIRDVNIAAPGEIHVVLEFFEIYAFQPSGRKHQQIILRNTNNGDTIPARMRRGSFMEFSGYFSSGSRELVFETGVEDIRDHVFEILNFVPGESTVHRVEISYGPD